MRTAKWFQQLGNEADVVLSTRIRLARNFQKLPFPASMTPDQKETVISRMFEVLPQGDGQAFSHIRMSELSELQAISFVEQHIISPEFAHREDGRALLLSNDESVSIMVGEEDHLRIQVIRPGLALEDAYREADCWDTYLDNRLHFAFDERLGYLTQCPSNLGTGMRASLMLHLPALQEQGIVQQLVNTVSKLGLTIRGMYGEGSKSQGAIYQLSNQITLGITEKEALENLQAIAQQIIKEERQWRQSLSQTPAIQDRIYRSLGILQNARLLSGKEFMSLISHVRMGVAIGLIDTLTLETVGDLLIAAQPAMLSLTCDHTPEAQERDELRAALVRTRLKI